MRTGTQHACFAFEESWRQSHFATDFLETWQGRDSLDQHEKFDGLEILSADGRNNRASFSESRRFIDEARRSIFVQSPYITFPFYERLRAATRRGVAVTIITPAEINWRLFANYARLESARSEIDLRLFKAMSQPESNASSTTERLNRRLVEF